jgi:hypothetical protein
MRRPWCADVSSPKNKAMIAKVCEEIPTEDLVVTMAYIYPGWRERSVLARVIGIK